MRMANFAFFICLCLLLVQADKNVTSNSLALLACMEPKMESQGGDLQATHIDFAAWISDKMDEPPSSNSKSTLGNVAGIDVTAAADVVEDWDLIDAMQPSHKFRPEGKLFSGASVKLTFQEIKDKISFTFTCVMQFILHSVFRMAPANVVQREVRCGLK